MIFAQRARVSPLSNSSASSFGIAMLTTVVRVFSVAVLLLAGFTSVGEVRAADELTGSNPVDEATLAAVPERVELTFDDSLDPEAVQIVVIAPNGARADTGVAETTADGVRSALPAATAAKDLLVRVIVSSRRCVRSSACAATRVAAMWCGQPPQ